MRLQPQGLSRRVSGTLAAAASSSVMERRAAWGAADEGGWGSWFVAGWGSETTDSDPRASGAEAVGVAGSARRGSARRSSSTLARRSPAAPPLLSDL